ncbi:MAG: S-methyl-5'-thioadenosine phosphorylase, partial [Gammaproteobacteria bacterium]|nr:S-methyl-5'-thioadenosine phosphorylase [Gammaproteobacteria bacterium]
HIPPHHIPYRANLWALNQLGVERLISPRAVGSLHEELAPGDIVITDQFVDFTKRRESTFYDGGEVGHISVAEPFCPELRQLAIQSAQKTGVTVHPDGTSICIEGPRYSTRAESIYFRDACKASTIGMTLVPECVLARELEICYLSIEAVTDYDSWSDEVVDTRVVKEVMKKNSQTLRDILLDLIPKIPEGRNQCDCEHALEHAMI